MNPLLLTNPSNKKLSFLMPGLSCSHGNKNLRAPTHTTHTHVLAPTVVNVYIEPGGNSFISFGMSQVIVVCLSERILDPFITSIARFAHPPNVTGNRWAISGFGDFFWFHLKLEELLNFQPLENVHIFPNAVKMPYMESIPRSGKWPWPTQSHVAVEAHRRSAAGNAPEAATQPVSTT